jgi:hypothetical protein
MSSIYDLCSSRGGGLEPTCLSVRFVLDVDLMN